MLHTWQPRAARMYVKFVGHTGAAPVIIILTRPPTFACKEQRFFFQKKLDQHKISMTDSNSTVSSWVKLCISMTFYVYLNFSEDKFVPDGVLSGNTLIQLCYFSAESQMQQPFLQWPVSLTKYLQRYETSLYWGWQQGNKFCSKAELKFTEIRPYHTCG